MNRFKEKITIPNINTASKGDMGFKRSLIWIGLAVLALVLDHVVPVAIWENVYYRGIFIVWRVFYDYVFGYSPIPMVYLVAGTILARFIHWSTEWKKGWRFQLVRAFGGFAANVFLFYALWAFNYHQIPLPQKLGFHYEEVKVADIEKEFYRASASLKLAAEQVPVSMTDEFSIRKKAIFDRDIRNAIEPALQSLGLPSAGRVRVRQLWPKGTLLRWSTAGIYIPQTGEGHIDEGLLSVQKPFTMAHEMAHGYGVTDEGICNFIAWLACDQSADPWMRYSGALTYWKYVAYEMHPDTVRNMLKTFPPIVEETNELIRANDKKYPDWLPKYRDAIYTSYLKHHGMENGLRSYDEVVLMVQQYLQHRSMASNPK